MHIHLEEWLQDLFGCVSATTNAFLHLVERVFRGVQQGLIHGPGVVFAEFLDFFGANRIHVLIELIRTNGLDQVFDGLLDLVILGFELLGLGSDPTLLHLHEFVERVGA